MNRVSLIVYPASDVPKAKKFFATLLGTDPYVDGEYYVGKDPNGTPIGLRQNPSGGL
jgi:hypothetical protein